MKQFREMFTTDNNIHRQWVKESVERLSKDGRFIYGSCVRQNGTVICYVLNKQNGKSFRCKALSYMQGVCLARCYARATGSKVGCLVREIPANAAFSYKDVITRDRVLQSKYDSFGSEIESTWVLEKYKRLDGEIGEYIKNNASVFSSAKKFYVEVETYYDLE